MLYLMGKTDSYDNLEELEAASPIIVYGKKVTEAEPTVYL